MTEPLGWKLTKHEWDESKAQLEEIYDAVVGTTTKPGMAEGQRALVSRSDLLSQRQEAHAAHLERHDTEISVLQNAPATALYARRQRNQRTWASKAIEVAILLVGSAITSVCAVLFAFAKGIGAHH